MERALQREDAGTLARFTVPSGQLEGGLHRLSTGVGEEHSAGSAGTGQSKQALGQLDLRRTREVVRHVRQRGDLCRHRLHQRGMRVTERVHGDPGEEVQVALSVDIPHMATLTAGQQRQRTGDRSHEVRPVVLKPGMLAHEATLSVGRTVVPETPNGAAVSTWGTRPSTITAAATPLPTAR